MTDRLAAAQAALNSGRAGEAIDHLIAAVTDDPARPAQVYRILAAQLFGAGRYPEGEAFAGQGLARYPRDYDLLNTRGVLLRKLKRQADAVPVLEQAVKLEPKKLPAQQNLGNVLLDLGAAARAEAVFSKLVRLEPRNAEFQRQLGRCLTKQGRIEPGLVRFRQAVALKRDLIDCWLDIAGTLSDEFRIAEALEALDKALAANPGEQRLLEAKASVLRRSGDLARTEQFLKALLPANPDAGWLHHQLGSLYADRDRALSNAHFEKAVQAEPDRLDYAVSLIEGYERNRSGDEGGNIEKAYQLAKRLLPRKAEFSDVANKIVWETLGRVCDFDAQDQIGDFRTLGRGWAANNRHTALMKQMSQVRSDEDRLELVEQHRIWGRQVDAAAARRKIKRPPPRPAGGKIRLGFMSSDLRLHPVGYFALPLFEHIDHERFEVFVYSYYVGEEADAAQKLITSKVSAYRWWPNITSADAAERIASDQLDMLIELGGSTHMNKLEVMAYRPAPKQASWLGYPHSAGLETIDYFVCDPFIAPPDPRMLIEKPLMLKHAWYPLSPSAFRDQPACDPQPPVARNGYVTFGTANQPHKYTRDGLRAWGRIMARCPGSHFLFIRPEGSSPAFQANLRAAFAAEGIAGDRIEFEAVRGAHLPHYNRMDISLDTFPQTGGTTTCESMWMGAPCVSLRGPAPYERLSWSVLSNVGLADLCSETVEGYVEAAVKLGNDHARIAELRSTMRERMRSSPLGQSVAWAADFYDAVERAVRA
ncbi:tetratricopeptide repeat protein [Phenylobacterium sp.]|uniref:O-linked N-acetylglucosamine transferase family protein n=1 Tax=Phenylobacterium sp. TaxID=1871053 RepID=UPI0025E6FA23|nr:tetratricopeptide repeat protein [Phenylobacterium sp.]